MPGVSWTFSADDKNVERALTSFMRAQDKLNARMATFLQQSKESVANQKREQQVRRATADQQRKEIELMKEAGRLRGSIDLTAQEKYAAKVAKIVELRNKDKITQQEALRLYKQYKAELTEGIAKERQAAESKSGLTEATRRANAVLERGKTARDVYKTDLAAIKRAHREGKITAEQLAVARRRVSDEFRRKVARPDENRVLQKGIELLGPYATAAGVAATAVQGIRAAWQTVVEQQEAGLAGLERRQEGERALLQIAASPQEFQRFRGQSERLSRETGVDIQTVQKVMFSAVSEGFTSAVPELIRANQVISPEVSARVAGQVPSLFQGQVGALEAVNLTLEAAAKSRLNFEELGKALPQAAEGGSVAKASIEETLGALSVLASRFKSGDTAADRIKAFATRVGIDEGATEEDVAKAQSRVEAAQKSLRQKEERVADIERRLATTATARTRPEMLIDLERAKREVAEFDRSRLQMPEQRAGLGGRGIIGAVEALQALPEAQLREFLGDSQELNVAFTVLSEELGTIKQRVAELRDERKDFAAGGGTLRERIEIAAGDPRLTALRERARAEQALEDTETSAFGIESARAVGASAMARELQTLTGGLAEQTVGRMGGNAVLSKIAARAGFDQAESAGIAAFGSNLLARQLFGPLAAFGRNTEALERVADKMQDAAGRLENVNVNVQVEQRPNAAANNAAANAQARQNQPVLVP